MFWMTVGLLAVLAFLLYRWMVEHHHKWDGTGVKVMKPFLCFGSYPKTMTTDRKAIPDWTNMIYRDLKDVDYGVVYNFKEPVMVITSPDLIKDVTIKNFDSFADRVVMEAVNHNHPEMSKMLTNLQGDEWKAMRTALSPSFTTNKLKALIPSVNSSGPQFVDYIKRELKKNGGEPLELKDTFKRYTMSAIASGVFGIDCRAFDEEDSEFVERAKTTQIKISLRMFLGTMFFIVFPRLAKFLGVRLIKKSTFFSDLTQSVMRQRRETKERRNDMLQLLIDLQDQGTEAQEQIRQKQEAAGDEGSSSENEQFEEDARLSAAVKKAYMTEDAITQSAILFLIAGFDTTSSSLSVVSYYLATNPEAQARARQEADDLASSLEGKNGEISYADVGRMEYIEMCIDEALRMSSAATMLDRLATQDYKLPCGNVIPKNSRIWIPVHGLHHDERYWDAPEEFRPERFSKENKGSIRPGTYLPFGMGPRNCIGMRFAMMEAKIAVYHLLRGFELAPSDKTPVPIEYQRDSILSEVKGGNFLKLTPREHTVEGAVEE